MLALESFHSYKLQEYFDYLKAGEQNLHAIDPEAMFKFVIDHISTVENSPNSLLEKERNFWEN